MMGISKLTNALRFLLALLLASEAIAQNRHPLEGFLLVADRSAIRTFDTRGKPRDVLHRGSSISAVDYDCSLGSILWSDIKHRKIHSLVTSGRQRPTTEVNGRSRWMPLKFAVESLTNKVYVADSYSGTVSLYDLNVGKFTVVISSNLTGAFGVAIDLEEGYLFVQDKYKVIRTDLDGANLKVIYTEYRGSYRADESSMNAFWPLNLTPIMADPQTKRLYFADMRNGKLISFNYEGVDKKTHLQPNSDRPFDRSSLSPIAILNGVAYWAYSANNVFKLDLNSKDPNNKAEIIIKNVQLQFIKAVNCLNRAQIVNPCKNNNGGCQDICVLSKSSQRKFKCACQVGFELADDNKSCIRINEFIAFTMENRLRGLSIANPDQPSVDAIDPSEIEMMDIATLDINTVERVLYYIKNHPKNQLHMLGMSNQDTEKVLNPDRMSVSVSNLAVDWVSRNLYYFSTNLPHVTLLNVLNLNNPTYSMVVLGRVEDIAKDIVVHPNRGYLFLTQNLHLRTKISRVALDGSNPIVIYQMMQKHIQTIALDYATDTLYWVEIADFIGRRRLVRPVLRKSDLDGQNVSEVFLNSKFTITSIAIHGDYIYAIVDETTVIRLSKLQSLREPVILADSGFNSMVTGLKVFSTKYQTLRDPRHPCRIRNWCEKFCFSVPSESGGVRAVCGCPYGEILATNGRTCVNKRQNALAHLKHPPGMAAPAA